MSFASTLGTSGTVQTYGTGRCKHDLRLGSVGIRLRKNVTILFAATTIMSPRQRILQKTGPADDHDQSVTAAEV